MIVAFYPCIYFTGSVNPCYMRLDNNNYKSLTDKEKFMKILERIDLRNDFYKRLYKFVAICHFRKLRLIFENPVSGGSYLQNNFLKEPSIIDNDRTKRGDYFRKPTGYWFFNCEPTNLMTIQDDKIHKKIWDCKGSSQSGLCSEERSMISPDYARNWICDFVLGKQQNEVVVGGLF